MNSAYDGNSSSHGGVQGGGRSLRGISTGACSEVLFPLRKELKPVAF